MKRIISIFLSLIISVTLTSCAVSSKYVKELEAKVTELESMNSELKQQIVSVDEAPAANKDVIEVFFGEAFTCGEIMELKLENASWCEEIYPSGAEPLSHLADNEGEKYLCIRGTFTNNAAVSVEPRYASDVSFTINGEYVQKGGIVLESTNGSNFNGIAKSLQTLNMVIYLSVSDALYEKCESVSMELKLVNNNEQLEYFYEDEFATDDFVLNLASSDIEALQ